MPSRLEIIGTDNSQKLLTSKFSISQNGFLPSRQPLAHLSDPYYKPWETLVRALPDLLRENTFQGVISNLDVLSTSKLISEEEWRRAYVILSFLAHGHIWGNDVPCEILPPAITIPYLEVSAHLNLPPVATYAALNLWNFSSSSPTSDFTNLESLAALHTFSGTPDESWFYVLSVAVEAQGAATIPLMLRAILAIASDDHLTVTNALTKMAECIRNVMRTLEKMSERCDPMVFYHRIRPFLAGTKNMGHAGLPRGVFFDEGKGKGSWVQLRGGSNGQSSLVQFFDFTLGVEHTPSGSSSKQVDTSALKTDKPEMGFHEEVRLYMPGPHRRFLHAVSRMDSIREYVLASGTAPDRAQLRLSYQEATKALGDFRNGHMQLVTRYIIVPSRKPMPSASTRELNLATVSSRSIHTNELTGTGGTALIPFLRTIRDETYQTGEAEAEVPRDARLICDTQGRLVFIGDCAPLSLFQTIRQLVTSRVDANAFGGPGTANNSSNLHLENISAEQQLSGTDNHATTGISSPSDVRRFVETFLTVTSSIVDLFDGDDNKKLADDIIAWANHTNHNHHNSSEAANAAVNDLILAIGSQSTDSHIAASYFLRGKSLALSGLSTGNLSIQTVQCFLLVTLYMLRSCQINGAFLFFGIAARAAYAIGLHRTELNDRFASTTHIKRDRLWKSVRVLDLYLSISTGRPPTTSNADCTVSYHSLQKDGSERYDLLNASVQVLTIIEEIILQVYSRRKISLQLTEGISRQLREWSGRWLAALHGAINENEHEHDPNPSGVHAHNHAREAMGACQVLASYYYAVMLVSRPFLMYELCKRLPETTTASPASTRDDGSGRSKLANACIDAATLMIGLVLDLIEQGSMVDRHMSLIVSWLFASSLVVGVGLLGGFGRALDKHAQSSVTALHYFGQVDAHASQYARIAESLRLCALEYLAKRDAEDRRRIAEDSTQLFGLMPKAPRVRRNGGSGLGSGAASGLATPSSRSGNATPDVSQFQRFWESEAFEDFDASIFSFNEAPVSFETDHRTAPGMTRGNGADQVFGGLNLFHLTEGTGHIDLAYLLSPRATAVDASDNKKNEEEDGPHNLFNDQANMRADPAKPHIVPAIPGASAALVPEDVRVGLVGTHVHEDVGQGLPSKAVKARDCTFSRGQQRVVFLPQGGDEPLPARVANDDVGQDPRPVVGDEVFGQEVEKGVTRLPADDVVAQSAVAAVGREGWEVGYCVEAFETALPEVFY
ncbi:IDO-domain-containing protein [Xylariaceae sp. FL0255]|nr:IDO-domain-containing protein [Xylariaceae sp. FL0255]